MKAVENKIIRFLEGHDKSFVILVYQRNYDWKIENCRQLFNDLLKVTKNKLMIIDSRQKITTLSLLIFALVHVRETGKTNSAIYG